MWVGPQPPCGSRVNSNVVVKLPHLTWDVKHLLNCLINFRKSSGYWDHAIGWKTHCPLLLITCAKYDGRCSLYEQWLLQLVWDSLMMWSNIEAAVKTLRIPNPQPPREEPSVQCLFRRDVQAELAPLQPEADGAPQRWSQSCLDLFFGHHLSGTFSDLSSHL